MSRACKRGGWGLRWGAGLRDLRPSYRLGLCASPFFIEPLKREPSDSPRRGCVPTDPAGVSDIAAMAGVRSGAEGYASFRLTPLSTSPRLEEDVSKGHPSGSPRMSCAPTDSGGVSDVAAWRGMRWGVEGAMNRALTESGRLRDCVGLFGKDVRLPFRLAPPRNDGMALDDATGGEPGFERVLITGGAGRELP